MSIIVEKIKDIIDRNDAARDDAAAADLVDALEQLSSAAAAFRAAFEAAGRAGNLAKGCLHLDNATEILARLEQETTE